jgi:hypothetical protein
VGALAELAGVSCVIFYRVGQTPRTKTAWKIANAYARDIGITPGAAYAALIVEEAAEDR